MRRPPCPLVALLLVAGCSRSAPSPSGAAASASAPAASAASARASARPATDAAATLAFAALRDRLLAQWLADEPSWGRELGLHEHDGKVGDYSAAGLAQRVARLQQARTDLAAVAAASLPEDDALDLAILQRRCAHQLFSLTGLDEPHRVPRFYEELFSVNGYLDRDYAPLPDRVRRLVEHEKAALAQVAHVEANLAPVLSRPVLETSLQVFAGFSEYLRKDVVTRLRGAPLGELRADFEATNERLAREADRLVARWKKLLPQADQSHVLGEARYRQLLAAQEGLTTPLADLEAMAEADLARNRAAYEALDGQVKPTRPAASALLATATRVMQDAARFVTERQLVTLASDDLATVKESPPFMRWNAAFLDASGPFDAARGASYYITLPDPTWPRKEQEEYLPLYGTLVATTVHEVYPGHFVQGRWVDRAPTRVQKMSDSYSFTEGWAHYAEQMMIEEGFGADDPQVRLGQLGDALLRNCRFVVSLGLHTRGMTLAQAEQRFAHDCHQDRATARQQAVRGTFDPGYFAYTLGKLQILALRDEAKQKLGARFSLRRFHDALLAHGSVPVALLHDRVLRELER
ncbi:MAG: DUF885 domain-containing protein [Myxococcales bacterium]|nr:MAG: DUF885 domain-containing protein [Myxococcales bacterium]